MICSILIWLNNNEYAKLMKEAQVRQELMNLPDPEMEEYLRQQNKQ